VLTIAPRIRQHAASLARLCGYLPLALRVAASTLAKHIALSPVDYLQMLKDTQQRLRLTKVDASLNLSVGLLSSDLQQKFYSLSILLGKFSRQIAGTALSLGEIETQHTLDILIEYSLVEYDPEFSLYHLHDLVQIFAYSRLDEEERNIIRSRFESSHRKRLRGLYIRTWIETKDNQLYYGEFPVRLSHRIEIENLSGYPFFFNVMCNISSEHSIIYDTSKSRTLNVQAASGDLNKFSISEDLIIDNPYVMQSDPFIQIIVEGSSPHVGSRTTSDIVLKIPPALAT
jgi:hypothetical protein